MGLSNLIGKSNKPTKVVLLGAVLYIILFSISAGTFEFMDMLVYAGIAAGIMFIVDKLDGNKRWTFVSILFVAVTGGIVYNVIGMLLEDFIVNVSFVLMAGLQQGLLTAVLWEIMGGRK